MGTDDTPGAGGTPGTDRAAGTDRTRVPGRWFRLRATLPRAAEDEVTGLAALAGCEGTLTQPAGRGRVTLECWFGSEAAARAALARIAGRAGVTLASADPEPVEDPGWLEASLRTRGPLVAGRFVVCDAPEDAAAVRAGGALPILLPPGRAFGTGEHATTRMCLELLGDWLEPGEPVLDLGTGSGILAIAAAQAGAGPVVAFDNDPHVDEVARENLALNGVLERVALATGSWGAIDPDARFGLVLANIHRTALVRSAPSLAARLRPGARVILSGFHPADAPLVEAAWREQGGVPVARRDDGEWTALAIRHP